MEKGIRVEINLHSDRYDVSLNRFFLDDLLYFLPEKGELFHIGDFIGVHEDDFEEYKYSYFSWFPNEPVKDPNVSIYEYITNNSWNVDFRSWSKNQDGVYVTLFLNGD